MYGRDHDQLPFFLNHPAVIGASSLSMTMSLLTIGSFVIFSDLRKLRYVELLTYVAFNDVLFSICTLMGNMKEGSIGCYFQGIVGSASCVSSAFWTTVITYQLYVACVRGRIIRGLKWYRVASVAGPLVFALLPLTTNTYAPDGVANYCFVDSKGMYVMWRIASFYIWILLGVTIQIVLLLLVFRRVFDLKKSSNNLSKIWSSVSKLFSYPLLFIICWSPDASINLNARDESPPAALVKFAIMTMILQGTFFGIVFFASNKVVRNRWYFLLRNNLILIYDVLGLDWGELVSKEEASVIAGGAKDVQDRKSTITVDDHFSPGPAMRSLESAESMRSKPDSEGRIEDGPDVSDKMDASDRGSHVKSDRLSAMTRPSLLDLGPDALDVTAEVDYIQPREAAFPRGSVPPGQVQGQQPENIEVHDHIPGTEVVNAMFSLESQGVGREVSLV